MTTAEILDAFPRYSALIVGDICLDRRCIYDPGTAEPSRETRIPRTGVVSSEVSPGGGGTVANNLAALGMSRIAVLGAIGEDGHAWELTRSLNSRGISTDLLVRSDEIPTFTYTKLINSTTGVEDQPRVDFIYTKSIPPSLEQDILAHLEGFASSFDIIFVSDQAETKQGGVVTAAVRDFLRKMAEADPQKVIWVDSRVRIERFRNVIIKPNEREAETAAISLFGEVDYQRLRKYGNSRFMFVTKSSEGVLVVEDGAESMVPARHVAEPVDICGAGDSFSAAAAVALAITGSAAEAARFGNLVASITIMKEGTGTATPEEVLNAAKE